MNLNTTQILKDLQRLVPKQIPRMYIFIKKMSHLLTNFILCKLNYKRKICLECDGLKHFIILINREAVRINVLYTRYPLHFFEK